MRYQVVTRQTPMRAWRWGIRCYVAVVDTSVQRADAPIRSGVVAYWGDLDARYDGPRSRYGHAIRCARAEAERLNREEEVTNGIHIA